MAHAKKRNKAEKRCRAEKDVAKVKREMKWPELKPIEGILGCCRFCEHNNNDMPVEVDPCAGCQHPDGYVFNWELIHWLETFIHKSRIYDKIMADIGKMLHDQKEN